MTSAVTAAYALPFNRFGCFTRCFRQCLRHTAKSSYKAAQVVQLTVTQNNAATHAHIHPSLSDAQVKCVSDALPGHEVHVFIDITRPQGSLPAFTCAWLHSRFILILSYYDSIAYVVVCYVAMLLALYNSIVCLPVQCGSCLCVASVIH